MISSLYDRLCEEKILWEAWRRVRQKNRAGGLDGVIPADLDARIHDVIRKLSGQLRRETYTPSPYQLQKTPKLNKQNEWRKLSLPVVTDKIVQQAMVFLVAPVFERDFLDCSYAYRPGKGPMRAVKRVEHILQHFKPRWVISCDIDNFFDTIDHRRMINEIAVKIQDARIANLIEQWLKAGYITRKGDYSDPEEGIAQGAVISPLLSNVYLHLLDRHATLNKKYPYVRYSDNFIAFFHDREKAYMGHEDITAFLEEKLALKLNPSASPYKHVESGFTFLGIFFKGAERFMSREKESKTLKKLNRLTHADVLDDPEHLLNRLNRSVRSQKQFYGLIKPDRQFEMFDDLLKRRIKGALELFRKKGKLKTKKDCAAFVSRVEFYMDENNSNKGKIKDEIFRAMTSNRLTNNEKKPQKNGHKNVSSYQHRSSAQKRRFLKQISEEVEVVINSPGVFIGKTGNRLVIRAARKNVQEHPFSKIRQITVSTRGISLSSDIVSSCAINKIPLAFVNPAGKVYATLQTPMHSAGDLSFNQLKICNSEKALKLAKKVITSKCKNQMNVLKYYARHRKKVDPLFRDCIAAALQNMQKEIAAIAKLQLNGSVPEAKNKLFTMEARAALHYWDIIKQLLPPELGFEKRVKQKAMDPVNNMLNYGYGILYQRLWLAVTMTGLNPNIGFLHSFQPGKPTFVFDVIEEFRQTMVDRPLFSIMTRGRRYLKYAIDPITGLLNEYTKQTALRTVLNRLGTLIDYRGKKMRAEDVIRSQIRQLAAYIAGKRKNYRAFISTY